MKATKQLKIQMLMMVLLLVGCGSSSSGDAVGASPQVPETPILISLPIAVIPDAQEGVETGTDINTILPVEVIETEEQGALVSEIIAAPLEDQVALGAHDLAPELTVPAAVETPAISPLEPAAPAIVSPVVSEGSEQIGVVGVCYDKKPLYIVLTDSRKAPRAERIKVKCVKSTFKVHLTIQKQDKSFLTLRTELQ